MTVGDIVKQLITAKDYHSVRREYPEEMISLIRDLLPSDYEYIKEKEEEYQKTLKNEG